MIKIKETEQYSSAKIRILLKTSPKNIRKKSCSKFVKVKLAKPQCHMLKKSIANKKNLKKFKGKGQNTITSNQKILI